MKNLILPLFLIVFFSCCKKGDSKLFEQNQLDSLENIIDCQNEEINYLKAEFSNVMTNDIEGTNSKIILYKPFGLSINLTNHRPDFNNKTFLSVPAAFTSKTFDIDGLFIKEGNVVSLKTNQNLNGVCIITPDSIQILEKRELSNKIINQVKIRRNSLFQQILLVKDSKIVDCDYFKENLNIRRAIILFKNNSFCIGQSQRRITIRDFQRSLIKIGAIKAIYLDMGSWSEGWYKDYCNKKIVIGETKINTKQQSNWIIYEKK